MDDLDETIAAAGPRLRALRQRQEITLAELSAATGISVSTLSRLESGARRPTLELLLPLARTFGVTLDELVDAPPTGDPRVHLRPVQRGGMTMLPLTRRAGGVQAYKIIISAGRPFDGAGPEVPRGLRVALRPRRAAAGRPRRARPGARRRARRPSSTPARRTGSGRRTGAAVEFLSLFGKQGERAHLRARPAGG